jgi:peptidyl-prolyl cis-trans isomerase D
MFDIVHKHKRIVQLVLALITLPFAFFGVDYYFRGADQFPEVASVGGEKITQNEFNDALREQQDRMRQALGRNFDPAMFESPEVRFAVLESVVNQRLLQNKARQESFRVTDGQLQQVIADIPAFQDNGRFSTERYRQLLAGQNMTPAMFEDRVRRELTMAPLQEPLVQGNIVARASGERYLGLLEQKREVAVASVDAEPFVKDVRIDDAQIKTFYDENQAAFKTPEQVKFEYVLLTLDAIAAQSTVDAADVKKQYDENAKAYTQAEERTASHILVAVKPDAKDAEKAAAKKKAEDLAVQARANPAKFGDLAKQFSQDPGSASQGGDLGSFARGTMVKPFEDAAWAMKVGDISDPVQTDFGWHVIKLTGITPAKVRPFDEVKGQIETDLKRQRAAQKFASAADQFQNLVYEQSDSLAGVAKALNVPVQTSPLVTRTQAQAIALGSAKFIQALFSPESLQSKRNTEAIEVGPNALMAARVLEYKPAAPRPFEEVKDEIRRQLIARGASEIAHKQGREKLALLEQGKSAKEAGISFARTVTLARNQAQAGFPPDALTKIFQVDAAKVPQYVGSTNERGGFSIYKVEKVVMPATSDPARLTAASNRVAEQIGRELTAAYLAALRAKSDVKINQANLDKK